MIDLDESVHQSLPIDRMTDDLVFISGCIQGQHLSSSVCCKVMKGLLGSLFHPYLNTHICKQIDRGIGREIDGWTGGWTERHLMDIGTVDDLSNKWAGNKPRINPSKKKK